MYNILYDGRVIHKNLSHEECSEVLSEYSEQFYEDNNFNLDLFEIEEI